MINPYKKLIQSMIDEIPDIIGFGFSYRFIQNKLNINAMRAASIAQYLQSKGYVGTIGDPVKGIWLLEKGYRYKYFDLIEKLPIIISYGLSAAALVVSIVAINIH